MVVAVAIDPATGCGDCGLSAAGPFYLAGTEPTECRLHGGRCAAPVAPVTPEVDDEADETEVGDMETIER
jgi:hypothetical protein